MKMIGIGKCRFAALRKSAQAGEEFAPYDLRFSAKGKRPMSKKREVVHTFLTRLYMEQAEHLPDGCNSNKRPRQGL